MPIARAPRRPARRPIRRPVRRAPRRSARRPLGPAGLLALIVTPLLGMIVVALLLGPARPASTVAAPSPTPERAPGRLWLVPLIAGTQVADTAGQTIDGCLQAFGAEDENGRYGCMAEVMAAIGERSTPEAAVSAIALANEQQPAFASECHMLSHAVGIGVFRQIGLPRVGEAIGIDSGLCGGGYHHGVIVSMAKSDPRFEADDPTTVASAFAEVCRLGTISATTPLERNCIHGSGHALVVIHDYDIAAAIEVCRAYESLTVLPGEVDGGERMRACAHGAFMENGWSGRVIGGPWTKLDDPSYPCSEFDTIGDSCWFNVAYQMAGDGYTRVEIAEACAGAARASWSEQCWVGFSRSGASLISPETTGERCAAAAAPWSVSQCIAEAAAELIDLFADPVAAARTCLESTGSDPLLCARTVGAAAARTETPETCAAFTTSVIVAACRNPESES